MPKIQLEVISEPEAGTAAVLVLSGPNMAAVAPYAIISGGGDTDYVCGACSAVLASNVNRGMLVNMVLKCAKCHSYNRATGT